MPRLIRLYITHCAIGFGVSAAFVALLLWLNVANLWHLVTHSNVGVLAVFLLWLFNGIVFAGAQFAFVIMGMARDTDEDEDRGSRMPVDQAHSVAVPVPAREPRNLRGR